MRIKKAHATIRASGRVPGEEARAARARNRAKAHELAALLGQTRDSVDTLPLWYDGEDGREKTRHKVLDTA